MEKTFMDILKESVLDSLDDAAIDALKTLQKPVQDLLSNLSAKSSSAIAKPIFMILSSLVPTVFTEVMKVIDKIDGKKEIE